MGARLKVVVKNSVITIRARELDGPYKNMEAGKMIFDEEARRRHRKGRFSYYEKAQMRFWAKVKKSEPEQCWEWLSVLTHDGYGRMWFGGRFEGAHRLSWIFTHGTIQSGMQVCHKCDNPSCVNPSHLFLGTGEDNMMDCVHKGRRTKSSAKLTSEQIEEIRNKYQNKEKGSWLLGREYGVSKTQILRIVKHICWQHVEKGLDNAYGNYQSITGERFARSGQRHRGSGEVSG